MRTVLTLCVVLVSFSGCGLLGTSDRAGDLQLFTDREAYAVEDSALVWFRNDENEPVVLSLCDSFLERRVGATWIPVPNERGCDLILLAPSTESVVGRDVVLHEYGLAGDLEAGTYRFSGVVAFVDRENVTERRLASNSFQLSE